MESNDEMRAMLDVMNRSTLTDTVISLSVENGRLNRRITELVHKLGELDGKIAVLTPPPTKPRKKRKDAGTKKGFQEPS